MNKIVTICGSMKFQKEMMKLAAKLELEKKYIVIQCVYFSDNCELTADDICILNEIHYKKIEISDAIYVVNVGGYIGKSTHMEIEYARLCGKEILYLEPPCEA